MSNCLDVSVAGALRGGIRRSRTTAPRSPYGTIALVGGHLRSPVALCAPASDRQRSDIGVLDRRLSGGGTAVRALQARATRHQGHHSAPTREFELSVLPVLLRSSRCWCRGWPRSVRTYRSPFLPARTSCLPAHACAFACKLTSPCSSWRMAQLGCKHRRLTIGGGWWRTRRASLIDRQWPRMGR